jgi:hypothetical protein
MSFLFGLIIGAAVGVAILKRDALIALYRRLRGQ